MKRLDPRSPAARQLAEGRYVIRRADAAVLAAVHIPWMREARWNPGLHDAETFLYADREGFFVGELDGQPIASLSAVRYDDSFGFMGCYLVREEFRGRGYGLAIQEAGRAHLEGCTQGGDGVLANVEKYKQIGRVYAYRNARYQGSKQGAGWCRARVAADLREVPGGVGSRIGPGVFSGSAGALFGGVDQPRGGAWGRHSGCRGTVGVNGLWVDPAVVLGLEDWPALCQGRGHGSGDFREFD